MIRRLIGALCVVALVAAPARPLPGEIVPWQQLFVTTAGPRWIDRAAQVQAESGFDPAATSSCGAQGPAQFMPTTWPEWSLPGESPRDPASAIRGQHRLMTYLEARFQSRDLALVGYNWGPGNVNRLQRRVSNIGLPGDRAWLRLLPVETQGYLAHNATFRARILARGGGNVTF